jgi:hypothetical protein
VFLFSSLFVIQFLGFCCCCCFIFCRVEDQSVQGAMLVYPRGSCGDTKCCLFAHLLVCVS